MATKIPEAQNRLFKRVFVCNNCHSKMKADMDKIINGKVKCRKCKKTSFRTIRKK